MGLGRHGFVQPRNKLPEWIGINLVLRQ